MPGTMFDHERMYTYLKGYFAAKGWDDATRALSLARKLHATQHRKGGQPYVVHPLTIACHAISLGVDSENVLSACLLHDVVEDCGVSVDALPVSRDAKDTIRRLTHVKPDPLDSYYRDIAEDSDACLVKLLDRCDNVSTMSGVFTKSKLLSYIDETRRYAPALYRTAKEYWPELSDAMFVLKYHIASVVNSLDAAVQVYEKEEP